MISSRLPQASSLSFAGQKLTKQLPLPQSSPFPQYRAIQQTRWLCFITSLPPRLPPPLTTPSSHISGVDAMWWSRSPCWPLLFLDLDPTLYSLHSLRRGGATAAHRQGLHQELIKRHGLWSSDFFWAYVTSLGVASSPVTAGLATAVQAVPVSPLRKPLGVCHTPSPPP